MAHYAFLDENIVTEVIVGIDENELIENLDPETWYGNFRGQTCKRTSINTKGGVHILGKTPFRKNYAGIGYSYDHINDVFIAPKPYASWILNNATWTWDAPTPKPEGQYQWDEATTSWKELVPA